VTKDKTIKKLARQLADLSIEDGLVSDERVAGVLEYIRNHPPRNTKQVLKQYLYYIKKAIAQTKAVIEYAGTLDDSAISAIEKNLSGQAGRAIASETRENAELIAGIRVTLGDNIYDASVAGRLRQLAHSAS